MYCCANCFSDPEIKAIINGYRHSGDCDFCGSKDVNVYDMERDSTIAEMFDGILDVYTPITDLPDGLSYISLNIKDVFGDNEAQSSYYLSRTITPSIGALYYYKTNVSSSCLLRYQMEAFNTPTRVCHKETSY